MRNIILALVLVLSIGANPTTNPTVYRKWEEIIKVIPKDAMPKADRTWNDVAYSEAKEALSKVKGRIEFVVKIGEVRGDTAFSITSTTFVKGIQCDLFGFVDRETAKHLKVGGNARISGEIYEIQTIRVDDAGGRSNSITIRLGKEVQAKPN